MIEEVTLEENTEEDSCLDMLATQNAEQFTPQMLAITKAQVQSPFRNIFLTIGLSQDEQQVAEDTTIGVIENSMPQFLETFSEWQTLMDRADKDKNADIQEILRSFNNSFGPLKEYINKMESEYFINLCL